MRHDLLRLTSTALALLGGIALASAQQPAPPPEPQQQTQQEKAQETPSGKAGKEEPSSHAPTSKPVDTAVLVNGALAVPGAAADSDTVPAKFSAQNAADDKLIITAYTFKNLSDEQRQAIYQATEGSAGGRGFQCRYRRAVAGGGRVATVAGRRHHARPANRGLPIRDCRQSGASGVGSEPRGGRRLSRGQGTRGGSRARKPIMRLRWVCFINLEGRAFE